MLKLHYYPDTASLVVRMVLRELGVPHEAALIDRAGGALNSPAYRALHPLGLIPALETQDGPMFETAAILLWLSDRHPEAALAPAPDSPDRAAFLKWWFFTSTNLHPAMLNLYYPGRPAGEENAAAVTTHARARITILLAALEAAAASRPQWLSPDRPTLLGYYLGMLMRWLSDSPADDPRHVPQQDYPALRAAIAAAEQSPAAQSVAADEVLGPRPFTLQP
jgi:glutathione S-transferase